MPNPSKRPPTSPAAPAWPLRHAPMLAAAVACVAYLPSLWSGFLYDDHILLDNRSLRSLGDLGSLLRAESARPLLSLSWALNFAVGGPVAWHFHLVNVLVHAANAWLAALLLRWVAERSPGVEAPRAVALLGACVFAASPMAAETVAYVSSRSTALATLFGLCALWLAAPALESGRRGRLAAALVALVLAGLVKEEAAAVPLLLLLLDAFGIARGRLADMRPRLGWHAAFVGVPLVGLVARRATSGGWLPAPALDPLRYAATQLAEFPGYLGRALVPVDPALYRGHPPLPWPPGATGAAWMLAGAGLLVGAVVARRKWPLPSLAVLWLAAGLLPSSSLVALKEMVVDHRAYLGSLGACLALAAWLWRPGRTVFAVALVALLGARSWHYQWVLADPARAWADAVRRAPGSAEAWIALGDAYAERGDDEHAEQAFLRAARADRRDPRPWANLGAFHLSRGRADEAAGAMQQAVRLAPDDARLHDNLGMILQSLGRESAAIAEYEAAVRATPRLAQPRLNLAALWIARGQPGRARPLLDEAAGLDLDAADGRRLEALRAALP